MEHFSIMTTATLRPDLLERTFQSFTENLFKDNLRYAHLFINIDTAGCSGKEVSSKFIETLKVISKFDFGPVSINYPDNPSFSRAFYWLLGRIKFNLTFNLEEDWELLEPIDFEEMVAEFTDPKLMHLRLSSFKSDAEKLKQWNKFIPLKQGTKSFFEVPRNLKGTIGWCGHPSLNRTAFLKYFLKAMNPEGNPEKQIKGDQPIILNSRFGVWQKPCAPATIKDIGRKWMQENGFKKKGNKAFFTNWEKI